MAAVTFKGKIQNVYNMDDTLAWRYIRVPKLERRHCDMSAFRCHPKFGGYANSDLFPSMLRKKAEQLGIGATLRLDRIPAGVEVDETGFLATVTFEL